MDVLLQELIGFVKSASPVLWAVYVRQSYVEGVGRLAFFIAMLVVGVVIFRVGLKLKKERDSSGISYSDDDGSFDWFLILVGVVLVGVSFIILFSSLGYFINPEYQAIQLIIETLK